MIQPSPKPALSAFALALLCGTSALAQPVATAGAPPTGISQEQFLALMGRLDALEKRNEELEKQVSNLKNQTAASDQAIRKDLGASKVTLNNGRPTIASGEFTASFRGILQLDAAQYDQRGPGPLASDFRRGSLGSAGEADRARDLADGTNSRRARLGVEGRAWSDWNYNLLLDFGGSGVEEGGKIINAYLEYAGLKPLKLRVGAFPPTTGFEDATSSSASLFLERPAPAELVRGLAGGDGRPGVAILANGQRWSVFTAITGSTSGAESFDEQLGAIGRVSLLPYRGESSLIHVGANANLVINPAATGPNAPPVGAPTPVRLRERPELRVDATRLVDTGSIDADGATALGVELGWQRKQLSLQAEHFWIDLDRRASALADPSFSGWYVQGAWTITGQPRSYSASSGGFQAPDVKAPFRLGGSPGVWELAARYSVLDLDYRAGAPGTAPAPSAIRGGEQRIFTFGLNWYPNNNVRFVADYQRVDVDRLSPGGTAFGAGALTPPAGAQIGQELNIWSFRTQYAF